MGNKCTKCKHWGLWTKSGQQVTDGCYRERKVHSYLSKYFECYHSGYQYFERKVKKTKKKK